MMRCQPALGTYVEIQAEASLQHFNEPAEAALKRAIDDAFAAIATAQACMSVFDPHSDLSRINAGAFLHASGRIHPWLWDVLRLAKEIHQLSPAFDPCAGHALIARGMRPSRGLSPLSPPCGSLVDVVLLESHGIVTRQPVYLDLGGIAKGYAVDRAVEVLQAHGVANGCVNAGGDLRVFGPRAHPIYVRQAHAPTRAQHVGDLQDAALATSADYFASGHLIDPQRGAPIHTPDSFSVLAPCCAVADALTKVYALTGDANHPAMRHFGAQALEAAL